jgi:hypothetical protein
LGQCAPTADIKRLWQDTTRRRNRESFARWHMPCRPGCPDRMADICNKLL